MSDDLSKEISQDVEARKAALIQELLDAPQGIRDSDMPPPEPITAGQVGPSPTSDIVNEGQTIPPVGGGSDPATGEESDPGDFDAGGTGVGDADTDGATRMGLD